MLKSFKKRIYTSIFLLILVFSMFTIELFFIYSLIVFSVLAIIEFLTITKIFIKKKINLYLLNIFFWIYIIFFCLLLFIYYSYNPLKLIILSLLLCCVASDIGGFIFGKVFKGPKLTRISPNKTISGAIGSVLSSFLILWILFYSLSVNLSLSTFLIAVITSVSCQAGDLFFSYLKRKAKIKDTGQFLPGHGGILDRLDGILLGVPVGILFISFFN